MQVLIIADDLTGALDSAVTLAEVGLKCSVARRPYDIGAALATRPDVLAVSTASREGGEATAREAVAKVLDATMSRRAIVFKKIDSRLKGHVAAELDVLAERTGITRALVAPAIPRQGRTTKGGLLTGIGVDAPIDVAAALAASGLDIAVPDASTDAELDGELGGALAGAPTLLVGAAGLAAALARHLRPRGSGRPAGNLPAPLVLAIGSGDPITLAQIDAVRATGLVDDLAAPGGDLASQAAAPGDRPQLVRLVLSADFDPRTAGARFAQSVAGVLAAGGARSLFSCGGETTDAILGELGVGVLVVEGEFLPGIPVSRMIVNGRTMWLITKSGGFGTPEALISVVKGLRRDRRDDFR
jgi:D-threonate/D-erythronate kinase